MVIVALAGTPANTLPQLHRPPDADETAVGPQLRGRRGAVNGNGCLLATSLGDDPGQGNSPSWAA